MLRASMIVATVVAFGCPSHAPPVEPPKSPSDVELRVRIARLEVRRAASVNELEELAHGGEAHQRLLALRALGRIGSPPAIDFLLHTIGDPDPAISSAALAALGVAGSLDDSAPLDGVFAQPQRLDLLLDRGQPRRDLPTREQLTASIEAAGRAAGVRDQQPLLDVAQQKAMPPFVREAVALAFGRMGRRKLALTPEVRAWLATATTDVDRDVRYGATYALMREHEPPPDEHVLAALAERVTDDDPEIRSLAIAALAKRGALAKARKPIEDSLRDRDWRVAVEAVRALAGEHGDVAGKRAVAGILDLRWTQLVAGHDEEAQIIVEALRVLAKPPSDAENIIHLIELARAEQLAQSTHPPRLVVEWTLCLAGAVWDSARGKFEHAAPCAVAPTIWGLTAIGDLVTAGFGAIADRRAALRRLLEHSDPRVRAAAIGALATLWKDGDANDRRTIVTTLIAALASRDPIIAGSAVDAAPGLYDAIGDQPEREQLDAAIVQRAANETDIELGASLFELIGKRAIGAGAAACRAGLTGHIVRARAAAECLKKLGEAVPKPEIKATEPPPNIDVADVIGKDLRWHLTTSRGEVVIQLRPDVAPWNVATIVALTNRHFYDGLAFHRVVPDFVVQGGDPTQSGWGGPGFTTPAEPASALDIASAGGAGFTEGGVGIADAGRDSGGSQWFVMHSRAPHLDGRYTWIGSVISGQKSADALLIGDTVIRACVEMRNYGGSANVTSACK